MRLLPLVFAITSPQVHGEWDCVSTDLF
jgi:hypothetical protein